MLARANRNGRTQSPNRQGASRSNPPQRAHGLSHGPPFGIADLQASPLPSGAWRREPERGPAPHSLISNFGSSRSEEHTSELQSLMRISYAAFCLNKKINMHQ